MKTLPEKHNAILRPIVNMFSKLETEGVHIEILDHTLHGSITTLATDNLALHQLLGTYIFI